MSDKELKNLRALQEVELENIKTIAEICEANDIRYFLIGGSLIGALRHHGFIPWDDDVDIGMPRRDYIKFVEIAKQYMPEYMNIDISTDMYKVTCDYAQFVNNRKQIYLDRGVYKEKTGIWVDIFPIDGLPSGRVPRELFWLNIKYHKGLYRLTQIDCIRTNVCRPFYEKAIIKIAKVTHIGKLFSREKTRKKYNDILQKYSYDNSEYVANFFGLYGKKEIVPKYQLSGNRIAKFEGVDVHIPEGAEDYLTSIYGDWRKLPPPEQRQGHPIEFAD